MRDDTLYTIGYDRKWHEERRAVLAKEQAREKRLERRERWAGIAGLGCYALLIVALVLIIAGLVLGYINVM